MLLSNTLNYLLQPYQHNFARINYSKQLLEKLSEIGRHEENAGKYSLRCKLIIFIILYIM